MLLSSVEVVMMRIVSWILQKLEPQTHNDPGNILFKNFISKEFLAPYLNSLFSNRIDI